MPRPNPGTDKDLVVVVHNIAWSTYKAVVFSRLNFHLNERGYRFLVADIADTERQRRGMEGAGPGDRQYPHQVLCPGVWEDYSSLHRSIAVGKLLISTRPVLVVLSGYFDWSFWTGLLVARLLGCRVITAVDSTEADRPRTSRLKEAAKSWFLRLSDAAFVYGSRARNYCIKLGMPADKIFVRCQAADNERVSVACEVARKEIPATRPKAFIFVGRVSDEKNIWRLLEAFRRLTLDPSYSRSPWHLYIVGAGPQLDDCREWVEREQLGSVSFAGGVPAAEVPGYFAKSDVLVLPSLSEPWGLVVNEAMACGLAAIVSDKCGCAPDLISAGDNGIIVDPLDDDALLSAMLHFVRDEPVAARMGEASKKRIEQFTPDVAALSMCHGVEFALRKRGSVGDA
jgi:glycosyltransferase involved in cell wall biosynthesis